MKVELRYLLIHPAQPEAGETTVTPVKGYCNAGKMTICFKFPIAVLIPGKKLFVSFVLY